MERSDVAIVLGYKLKNEKKLPRVLVSRLNLAINLYKKGIVRKLIMSGGITNPKLKISEAEAMRQYVLKQNVKDIDIIKDEKSKDTIGNAYFIKNFILKPCNFKKLVVISSDFHLVRMKYVFKKTLGRNYKIKFLSSRSLDISLILYKVTGLEQKLFDLTKLFFGDVKEGDDMTIRNKLFSFHPEYANKEQIENLLKMSNEDLAKKLNVNLEAVKRYKDFVIKRFGFRLK